MESGHKQNDFQRKLTSIVRFATVVVRRISMCLALLTPIRAGHDVTVTIVLRKILGSKPVLQGCHRVLRNVMNVFCAVHTLHSLTITVIIQHMAH